MDTARLFQSGLLPMDDPWQTLETGLAAFEPGFVLTRQQPDEQIRAETSP